MKRTTLILGVPVALALAATAVAAPFAGGFGHRGRHHDPEKMLEHAERVMDEIDATDDQKATARTILEEAMPTVESFREEAGLLREEIKAVFQAETIDRSALEDSRQDLLDLVDRATAYGFGTMAGLAEVFTPEQRAELQELREKRRERFMERHGEHGPRGRHHRKGPDSEAR